jgi:hypothetical protein
MRSCLKNQTTTKQKQKFSKKGNNKNKKGKIKGTVE